jgi:bacilysin biosynthesis protein BacA
VSNPHSPICAASRSIPGTAVAAEWLHGISRARGRIRIASIGPTGTSADDALAELTRCLPAESASLLRVELCSSFEVALTQVLEGAADYALVPSAYRDATAFHWNPLLELACVFVHRTPDYGLAVMPNMQFLERGGLVVAAMPEVQEIYDQLAPEHLAGRPREFRIASSTSDAAAIVGDGAADIAVCNEHGRREHELAWVSKRQGAEIVWMLFELRKD